MTGIEILITGCFLVMVLMFNYYIYRIKKLLNEFKYDSQFLYGVYYNGTTREYKISKFFPRGNFYQIGGDFVSIEKAQEFINKCSDVGGI